jgi:hypothetical protein
MAQDAINKLGGTIAAGQSVSNVVKLFSYAVVGLTVPADWTPAVMSVIVSPDGNEFYDLFDGTGHEFTFNVVPGAMIQIDPVLLSCAVAVKLRSGTRDAPVAQQADCVFALFGLIEIG